MEAKLKKEKARAEKYKRKFKVEKEKNKNEESEQTKGMLTYHDGLLLGENLPDALLRSRDDATN